MGAGGAVDPALSEPARAHVGAHGRNSRRCCCSDPARRARARAQAGEGMTSFDLERYEQLMASVLIAPDPIVALEALDAGERALLEPIDRDGLRMAALLVARLRFERLMHGSMRAAAWFGSDPR